MRTMADNYQDETIYFEVNGKKYCGIHIFNLFLECLIYDYLLLLLY